MTNLEIANAIMDFLADTMKQETLMIKSFGVIQTETKQEIKMISLWACRTDLKGVALNPIERIEQLVLENSDLKNKIAVFEKQKEVQNGN